MTTIAIITAAGQGKRMGQPKQFLKLGSQTILQRTVNVFDDCAVIDGIILVVNKADIKLVKKIKLKKIIKIVAGGRERQNSVYNGIKALPEDTDIVVIHDGARPFVTAEIIKRAVNVAKQSGAVVVGVPVKDTIKQINNEGIIIRKTLDRKRLWQAQTPQVFQRNLIVKAYKAGYNKNIVTDDSMLVEQLGSKVVMVLGSYINIKITTPEDLIVARGIIKKKKGV